MTSTSLAARIEHDGFAIVSGVFSESAIARLQSALDRLSDASTSRRRGAVYGARNLLREVEEVRVLPQDRRLRSFLDSLMSSEAFAVRALFFDKTPAANWSVAWHQDRVIPVQERYELPGFGPWSVKAGVVHVQPPLPIMERVLATRIHLDDCDESHGPLQVIPGSNRLGYLDSEAIDEYVKQSKPVTCVVPRGGVVLMRPLLLHASAKAKQSDHRRVIHIEFADEDLPPPLRWPHSVSVDLSKRRD